MKHCISLTILGKTQYSNLAFFLSFPLLAWGDWTAPTAAIQSCISPHIERNFCCFVQASFRGIHESSKVTRSCHNFIKLQRNMGVHCRANRWSCCRCLGLQLDTTPRARTLQAADQTLKELQELNSQRRHASKLLRLKVSNPFSISDSYAQAWHTKSGIGSFQYWSKTNDKTMISASAQVSTLY